MQSQSSLSTAYTHTHYTTAIANEHEVHGHAVVDVHSQELIPKHTPESTQNKSHELTFLSPL